MADGARTHDNQNHNLGLYQLSYSHHRTSNYSRRPRYQAPRSSKVSYFAAPEAAGAASAAALISTLSRFFSDS